MAVRKDPWRNSRFFVEIDGIVQAGFSEVTVPDSSTDVIEYREGTFPTHTRKIPGLTKYSNIVLKWGTTDSKALHDWYQQIVDGKISEARKNISVIAFDERGEEAARWNFVEAWPTKYDPADMNAKGNDIAIETLEVAHEGMVRVK